MNKKKRYAHILIGTIKPTMNMTIGIFIGKGNWSVAIGLFLVYLMIGAAGDFIYWGTIDDAMKETRKRLEAKK